MINKILILGVLAVVLAAGIFVYSGHMSGRSTQKTLQLKGQTLRITTAATDVDRERGLGGRGSLGRDEGMLFIFDADGKWAFWMKDMSFSIDMVWLSSEKKVVYMAQNVAPESYPSIYTPDTPVRYVLELPAGWAKAHNVAIGDVAQF